MQRPLTNLGSDPEYQALQDRPTIPRTFPSVLTQHNSDLHLPKKNQSKKNQSRVTSQSHTINRRNRVINSCLACRRRKTKCDKSKRCANCVRNNTECVYVVKGDRNANKKLADIKEKMGALERKIEVAAGDQGFRHASEPSHIHTLVADDGVGRESDFEDEDDIDDEESLEPTPLASLDNVYETTGDDALLDCGVQMGKLSFSERIGGWLRPKLVNEIQDTLADVRLGKSRHSTSPQSNDHLDLHPSRRKVQAIRTSYVGPGPDYIAPPPGFFFSNPDTAVSLLDYLPSKGYSNLRATKDLTDRLIDIYWSNVHQMCKIVHRPSFEIQYGVFWDAIDHGHQTLASTRAVVFAALFSAAVSTTEEESLRVFSSEKKDLVGRVQAGTEAALAKANVLRTTKIDTVQAFTMYLIPFVRGEVSRTHSTLVGAAIRLAECLGLHRDGTFYGMSPVETQVRRMIWHQLCFLDYRTGEAVGPRPQIRSEDYDTKLPWNVDDTDLMGPNPPPDYMSRWTDMTFTLMRSELTEMKRQVLLDVIAVDRRKKSLGKLLVRIQKFGIAMKAKYSSSIGGDASLQRMAQHLLEMHIRGLQIQALHRYLFSATQRMPDKLRQILIDACLTHMENAMELERNRELQPWQWYRGAFNQYHAALLLIVEVYAYPMRKDAARIWSALDYVFEVPSHLAPKQKAELIFSDLQQSLTAYESLRKVKMTTFSEQKVNEMNNSSAIAQQSVSPSMDEGGQPQQKLPTFSTDYGMSATFPDGSGPMDTDPDYHMSIMDDIDWDELNQYYDQTGDLDFKNFDMAQFTGETLPPPEVSASNLNLNAKDKPNLGAFNQTHGLVNYVGPPSHGREHALKSQIHRSPDQDLADVDFTSLPFFADRPTQRNQRHGFFQQ